MNDEQNPQYQPPQAQPAPAPAPTAPPAPPRGAGKTIGIVTAIVGGIAIVVAGGSAAWGAIGNLNRSSAEQRLDVSGIDSIDLSADASDVVVRFGDVNEAVLTVKNSRGDWTMKRDGDELEVFAPDRVFGWWFGGWFGDEEKVTLTLPRVLDGSGLSADFDLSAGSLDVEGDYTELSVSVSAGSFDIEGSAETFDLEMSAGNADVLLDGVTQAEFDVSAGDADVELTGAGPKSTTIELSAGTLRLTLPDVDYAVTQDVSAGSVDIGVDQTSGSSRTIDLSVAAGTISIRPGD